VSLDDLQRAVDASLASASSLTREIFGKRAMDAASVQRFINKVLGATVATVRADGRPHAALVLAACSDGTVYFTASVGSVLLRNLEGRADVALTVTDADHDVTIHGQARRLGMASQLPDLVTQLHHASKRGQFIPSGWDGYLYEVTIDKIFTS